jgi:hypothetical protein
MSSDITLIVGVETTSLTTAHKKMQNPINLIPMKKLFVIIAIIAFATSTFAAAADSVKSFSQKEYVIIAGTDTTTVTAGDSTTTVTFTAADSLKATGKTDTQMINGQKTKIKQVISHGKKFWIKGDVDLDCIKCLDLEVTMWCDEDESSDPISAGWYGLMGLVVLLGGFAIWKSIFRG